MAINLLFHEEKSVFYVARSRHTSSSKNVVSRLVFVSRFFWLFFFFDNVIPFASWTHNSSPSHKKVFIFFSNKKFLFSRRKPFMVLIYVDPRAVSTSCFFFGCLFFLYLLVKWPIYFSSRPKHVSRAGLSDRLDDKNARNKFRFLSTRQSLLDGKKNLTEFLKYRKRRFGVTLSYTYIGTESTEECVAYQLSTSPVVVVVARQRLSELDFDVVAHESAQEKSWNQFHRFTCCDDDDDLPPFIRSMVWWLVKRDGERNQLAMNSI